MPSGWPRSVRWIESLVPPLLDTLTTGMPQRPPEAPFLFCFVRNLFFTAVVLGHGLRRLLPPY